MTHKDRAEYHFSFLSKNLNSFRNIYTMKKQARNRKTTSSHSLPSTSRSRKSQRAICAALIVSGLSMAAQPSWAAVTTIGNLATGLSIPTNANLVLTSTQAYVTDGLATSSTFNTLTFSGSDTVTIANQLVLSSTNGATTITSTGTTANLLTGGTVTTGTSTIFTVNTAGADMTIGSVISGSTGLTKTGVGGTLTLTNTNNYTGTTSVGAGTLVLNSASGPAVKGDFIVYLTGTLRTLANGQVPTTSNLLLTGGVLDTATTSGTFATVTMGAGGAIVGSGTVVSLANYSLQGGTISAVLSGTAGASIFSGTTVLMNANKFTGLTTVSSGVLQLNSSVGPALAGNVLITGGTMQSVLNGQMTNSSTLTVNGGTFDMTATSGTLGALVLNGGSIVGSGTSTSLTDFAMQSGTVSASLAGSVGLNKTTTGSVTLAGSNSYTGTTTVSGGTLILDSTNGSAVSGNLLSITSGSVQLNRSNQIATTASVQVAGGTLAMGANSNTVTGVQLASGAILGSGTLTSFSAFDVQSGTAGAVLAGAVGLNKTTSGTATLTGSNTYTGTTTVSAGTLILNATGAPSVAGNLTVNGGVAQLAQSNQIKTTSNVAVSSGTLAMQNFSNTVNGVQITGGAITGSGTLSSATAFDVQAGTISATLGGTQNLVKTTSGTATLSGSNVYTGLTDVQGGTLILNTTGAPAVAGALKVSGGIAQLAQSNQIKSDQTVTVTSGSLALGANNNTVAGVQMTGGAIVGTGTLTSTTAFDLQSGTAGASLAGAVGLNKTSTGSVTLAGSNSYTGTTSVNGGTLILDSANGQAVSGGLLAITSGSVQLNRSNQIVSSGSVQVAGGTLALGANSNSVNGLQITAGAITGSGTLTSANTVDAQAGTIGATLAGAAGLTKTGGGTVTLTGSNTYTGLTDVQAGTLVLNTTGAPAISGSLRVSGGIAQLNQNDQIKTTGGITVNSGTLNLQNFNNTVNIVHITGGAIVGSGTLTSASAFDVQAGTISASLGGSVGLIKSTSGTATLSGSNVYTGLTDVQAGTLILNTTGAPAIAGPLQVSGGIAQFNQSNQIKTTSGVLVTSGTLSILGFNNTVAGVQLAGGAIQGTGGTLTDASNFDVRAGSVSAILGGSVGLIKTTAGTVTLTGANTYTGLTDVQAGLLVLNSGAGPAVAGNLSVNGGTVQLGQNNQIKNTSSVVVTSGTLDMQGHTNTVSGVQVAGGSVVGSGTLTSTTAFDLQSGYIGASLAGSVGANKTTAGTVTLAGSNSYTGTTTVSGGLLNLDSANGSAVPGALTITSGSVQLLRSNQIATSGSVRLTGGELALHSNSNTVDGVQLTGGAITGSGTLTSAHAFDLQSGSVSASLGGSVGLVKTTAGTVTLSGSNVYTGATDALGGLLVLNTTGAPAISGSLRVNGGTVRLAQNNQIKSNQGVAVTSGVLDLQTFNNSVAGVLLNGGGIIGSGTLTSATSIDAQSGSVAASLSGTAGLVKTTAGTVTLTGSNTYTGLTDVQAGTLALNTTGGHAIAGAVAINGGTVQLFQSEQISGTSQVTVNAGALDLQTHNNTVGGLQLNGGLVGGSGTLTSVSNYDMRNGTVAAHLSGTSALVKTTFGTVNLNNTNSYTGGTVVNQGTLQINGAGTLGDPAGSLAVHTDGVLDLGTTFQTVGHVSIDGAGVIQNGTLSQTGVDSTGGFISAVLTGSGGLTHTSGTLTLTGANTFTGATNVTGGLVVLNTIGSPAIIADAAVNGGELRANRDDQLAATSNLAVNSGTANFQTFNDTVAGVRLTGGEIAGSGTLTSLSNFDLQAGVVNTHLNGAVQLVKSGSGTVTLTNSNDYTGGTSVDGGTLQLAGAATLGATTNWLNVNGAGTILDLGASSQTAGSVGINGGTIQNGSLTATDYTSTGGFVSANLGGAGTWLTLNSGTLRLTGANTYSGVTMVNSGMLAIGDGTNGTINPNSYVAIGTSGVVELNLAPASTFANVVNTGTAVGGILRNVSSGAVTLSNVISGKGSLVQAGSDILTLTHRNYYGGNTVVSSGVLDAAVSRALPILSNVQVAGGARLVLSSSANPLTQCLGSLSGAGSVDVSRGNIIVGFANTPNLHFSGDFIGNPHSFVYHSTQDWVVDSPDVPFDIEVTAGGLAILTNVHPHGLGLSSLPNMILTGHGFNSLLSGTTTMAGFDLRSATHELTVGVGGTVCGSILVEKGTLNVEAGGRVDGQLTMTGGFATVNGILGDSRDNPALKDARYRTLYGAYVGANAGLTGGGTIAGDLINAGTIQPGDWAMHSVAANTNASARSSLAGNTLTVGGNFIQNNTGLILETLGATSYGRLAVAGTATLAGNVLLDYQPGFNLSLGDSLTILTAGAGVHGSLGLIDGRATGTLLSLGLVNHPNSVSLEWVQGSFAGVTQQHRLTANQSAVATALDSAYAQRGWNSKLVLAIDDVKLANLPSAFEELSPSGLASIFSGGIATESVQSLNIQRRLEEIRNGATGFSSSAALADNHGGMNFDGPLFGATEQEPVKFTDVKKNGGTPAVVTGGDARWGTFLAGAGEFVKLNSDINAKGSELNTAGVTAGVDYRFSKNFVAGVFGGYSNTSASKTANGSADLSGGKAGVYSTWFNDGFYIDGSVDAGFSDYDTKRSVLGSIARGSTTGMNWNALLGGGFDRKTGAFAWGPIASVQYTHVGIDAFSEKGSLASLAFPAQGLDSVRTQVGVHASYLMKLGTSTFLTPDIRVQWQHEFMDATASIASRFVDGGSTFSVSGPALKRDSVWVDAGFSLQLSPAFTAFAYYTGNFGQSTFSSTTVSGGLRVSF